MDTMIAPINDGGIYYSGPSEDWSRPGRMWWSVPSGPDSFFPGLLLAWPGCGVTPPGRG